MIDMLDATVDLAGLLDEDKIRVWITDPTTTEQAPSILPSLWRVVVRLEDRVLMLPYYMTDSRTPPTPLSVMSELIESARKIEESASIEEWAGLPESEIPLKTEYTYQWHLATTERLRRVLQHRYPTYLSAKTAA
jgi:hypothetical protein